MPINFVQDETSNLEALINLWAKVWANHHGSKLESVLFTKGAVDALLHRRLVPNSDLYGKGCYLDVVPAAGEPIKIEEASKSELPPKSIKEISGEEVNGLQNAYQYTIANEFTWQSTHTVSEQYTSRLNFGVSLGTDFLAQLGATIQAGFEKSRGKAEEETKKTVNQFTREITCKPGFKTHVQVSYVEAKVKYRIQCPVKLQGYVLLCCENEVLYTAPGLSDRGRKSGSAHKKWAIPIGQVLNELLALKQEAPLLNKAERLALANFQASPVITPGSHLSEVKFMLETEAEGTELLRIETAFSQTSLPGYAFPAGNREKRAPDKASPGKALYLKPVIRGDYADLFTIEGSVDGEKRHQQILELLDKMGLSGALYAEDVIEGDYAEITRLPAAGMDSTTAALYDKHLQYRQARFFALAANKEGEPKASTSASSAAPSPEAEGVKKKIAPG